MNIKLTRDYTSLPEKERPFAIPSIYHRADEFTVNGKKFVAYFWTSDYFKNEYESVEEVENHKAIKRYEITGNPTLDDIKQYIKETQL